MKKKYVEMLTQSFNCLCLYNLNEHVTYRELKVYDINDCLLLFQLSSGSVDTIYSLVFKIATKVTVEL